MPPATVRILVATVHARVEAGSSPGRQGPWLPTNNRRKTPTQLANGGSSFRSGLVIVATPNHAITD